MPTRILLHKDLLQTGILISMFSKKASPFLLRIGEALLFQYYQSNMPEERISSRLSKW